MRCDASATEKRAAAWLRPCTFAGLPLVAFLFAGCLPTTGPTLVQSASHASTFTETSVAVVPLDAADPTKRNYVIAFNQNFRGRQGRPAWSVSTDLATTWQPHLESEGGGWGDPPEAQLLSGHFAWFVDPTVVYTGNPGQAAFFTLGLDDRGQQVAVALSTDGGKSFSHPHLVSTAATGGAADAPVAALNRATGDIWVWWTVNSGLRHFLCRVSFDAAGTFHADAPVELTGRISGTVADANLVAARLKGRDAIALAYSDTPDLLGDCPAGAPSRALHYHLAESTDGGLTWATQTFASDPAWPLCVTDANAIDGFNRDNRLRPAMAVDPFLGAILMAVTLSGPHGSVVHLFSTIDVALPAVELVAFDFPCPGTRCDEFGPAVAVAADPSGRRTMVAVTWHDTRDDPLLANHRVLIQGATSPNDGILWNSGPVSLLTTGDEQVPWELTNDTNFGWGDYEGMAGDDVSSVFIPAWSDNRKGRGSTEVWTAKLRPFADGATLGARHLSRQRGARGPDEKSTGDQVPAGPE